MIESTTQLQEQCDQLFRDQLERPNEATRSAAYELGRQALDGGLGVLDLATLLARSLSGVALEGRGPEQRGPATAALEGIALDLFSPFEMAHRAVGEANAALRRGNEAREEELKRIAHAIHDEVGQLLVRMHWAVDDANRIASTDVKEKLLTVAGCLEAVEGRLRRMSYELRPTLLDDLGLEAALRSFADGLTSRSGITVSVEGASPGRLPPRIETVLYRVVQEALRNVVKHARARSAVIRLHRSRGAVLCAVRDDGIGFSTEVREDGATSAGLGLIGIRERVAQVGGTVAIQSQVGHGAEVLVSIPLGSRRRAADPARG